MLRDRSLEFKRSSRRGVFSAVIVLGAFLLRRLLVSRLGLDLPPFIFFYPVVMAVPLLFGFWAGIFATSLAASLAELWIFSPAGRVSIARTSDIAALSLFWIMGVLMSAAAERYRRLRDRLAELEKEQAVKETTTRLEAALASMVDAVFIVDHDRNLVHFNEAFAVFHRFKSKAECFPTLDQYVSILEFSLLDGSILPLEKWPMRRALCGETVDKAHYLLRRKDTGETWVGSYNFNPIRDQEGSIVGAVASARDITDLRRSVNALQASEERYRTVFRTSVDAIIFTRLRDGIYIDVSEAFCAITQYPIAEVIGRTSLDLGVWVNPDDRFRLTEILLSNNVCHNFEVKFRRRDGEEFWGSVSASIVKLQGEQYILSVVRDISESKHAEAQIQNLAFFDSLTGLANRRLLMDKLHRSIAAAGSHRTMRALLLVDLDDFKKLNDVLGHQSGDHLLQITAHRLASCIRKTDTVARLGGDEFILFLDGLSDDEREASAYAADVAAKVLDAVQQPYRLDWQEWFITCSIGACLFGSSFENATTIMQQADMAMYKAKSAGRNTVRFFDPEFRAAAQTRVSIEEELRKAVQSELGQFLLYFQPQIESGRVVGAEALLRWNHPRRGIIPPSGFIDIAEETGLIVPIGTWALSRACQQLAHWAKRAETANFDLSVNISIVQLRRPDFVHTVLREIELSGADPRKLKLEITESTLLENMEDAVRKMEELKTRGIRFSLDDFGTGYSSLSYLKRLPLAQVKIDRSFVRDILVDEGSAAIARAIISLGDAMGLPAIAEGVETEEQRSCLAEMGCYAYQGFLFAPPLPLDGFEKLLPSLAQGKAFMDA